MLLKSDAFVKNRVCVCVFSCALNIKLQSALSFVPLSCLQVKLIFDLLDVDHSGKIDAEEMKRVLSSS